MFKEKILSPVPLWINVTTTFTYDTTHPTWLVESVSGDGTDTHYSHVQGKDIVTSSTLDNVTTTFTYDTLILRGLWNLSQATELTRTTRMFKEKIIVTSSTLDA